MARPPYTTVLWRGTNSTSGFTGGPSPPVGFEWVIRNVDLLTPGSGADGVGKWLLQIGVSTFLLGWGTTQLRGGSCFSWEGRQALSSTETLAVVTDRAGFSWAITGFQFAVPS